MADLRFEWDSAKDTANQRKHGVSFEEAATVFEDEHALLLGDCEHSDEEDRFVLLGLSAALQIRKADRSERRDYRQRLP